ncbi:MAG: hypothetical protein PHR30_18485 [Gallionellaceae bacterium]|nr:hypothetical protein [Gallionellaceae bacterium]
MSTGAVIGIVVGVAAVGGGVIWYMHRRQAAASSLPITPMAPAPTAKSSGKSSVGAILSRLGGKALKEGAKLAVMGPVAYQADAAQRALKSVA